MEGLPSDSISTPRICTATLPARPIKRTISGHSTSNRFTQPFPFSSSITNLQQIGDAPHNDGGTNPLPQTKEWHALQCLKTYSDSVVLRWLDYARYPDRNINNPQPAQQRVSLSSSRSARSSDFSGRSYRTSDSSRSLYSGHPFHDDPPPPVPNLEPALSPPYTSNAVEEYRQSKLSKDAALGKSSSLPMPKYFCTFCDKGFGRKGDWKSHEKEFHERQDEFACTACNGKFSIKHRFIRHHLKRHGCEDCPHAETCRSSLPKKRAWGCGFCGQYLDTFDNRYEHIAKHYEAGMERSKWNHSLVILGLLRQPNVVGPWSLVLGKAGVSDWSTCSWAKETTNELQRDLELEGLKTGAMLAMDAYSTMKCIAADSEALSARTPWIGRPVHTSTATPSRNHPEGGFYPGLNSSRNTDMSSLSLDHGPPAFYGYEPDQDTSGQGPSQDDIMDGAFTFAGYQSPPAPIYEHSFYDDDD